jgi:hypothetical protein
MIRATKDACERANMCQNESIAILETTLPLCPVQGKGGGGVMDLVTLA